MSLFTLTENYIKFFTEFDNADEITDEMQQMADNLNVEIEEKCENYANMIKSLEADIDTYKHQEKVFNEKRKTIENKVKWLKQNLQASMEQTGRKKVKTKLFTVSLQKNAPSLEITNEKNIDDSYYIIERKLNKRELLNDIKEGLIVDGVGIKQTESLRIR
ncbi:MAG: siphovirus Gp157 family protein [Finegoldia magna]|nr:siphovirus Gp157 family protein [Finegoldia magna]